VFFVFVTRRPPGRAILLVLAAVAWVLVANVVRVAGVAYITTRWGIDLTEGWKHEAFGLGLFALALLLLVSTDQLLGFLLAPPGGQPEREPTPAPALEQEEAPRPSAWWAIWPFAVGYAGLLAAHVVLYGGPVTAAASDGGAIGAAVEALNAASLPAEVGRWQRQGFATEHRNPGSAFGEFSKLWRYQQGEETAIFSLDYPFPSWHDLTRCYTGQGWAMEEQAIRQARSEDGAEGESFMAVRLTKPGYRSGYLLFGQCDRDGNLLEPHRGAAYLALDRHRSVLQRWLDRGRGTSAVPAPASPVYQFQLLVECYAPLTPSQQAEVEQFFVSELRALRGRWSAQPPKE
jgi:exosortase/archaeosortase family protein